MIVTPPAGAARLRNMRRGARMTHNHQIALPGLISFFGPDLEIRQDARLP